MFEKFTIFEFGAYLRAFSVSIRHVFFDNIFYNWLLFILPYVILMVYYSSGLIFVVFLWPSMLEICRGKRQVLNCDGRCRFLAHFRKFILSLWFPGKNSSNLPNTIGEGSSVVYGFGHIVCGSYNKWVC